MRTTRKCAVHSLSRIIIVSRDRERCRRCYWIGQYREASIKCTASLSVPKRLNLYDVLTKIWPDCKAPNVKDCQKFQKIRFSIHAHTTLQLLIVNILMEKISLN